MEGCTDCPPPPKKKNTIGGLSASITFKLWNNLIMLSIWGSKSVNNYLHLGENCILQHQWSISNACIEDSEHCIQFFFFFFLGGGGVKLVNDNAHTLCETITCGLQWSTAYVYRLPHFPCSCVRNSQFTRARIGILFWWHTSRHFPDT